MAFKVRCDNCGHIVGIDSYHQYTIVDTTPERAAPSAAYAQAQNSQNALTKQTGPYPYAPPPRNHEVHLCPTCFPIWMNRVKKLTEHTQNDV